MLCYATGEALHLSPQDILPWALALEAIHTYSLIHDDLPAMDNDDLRRGLPTNHMKFSEDIALLAGDALLTEAFLMIAQGGGYGEHTGPLIELLSEGVGLKGMIRGQILDLGQGSQVATMEDLIHLHELKTGCLIALCLTGPALLTGQKLQGFQQLGLKLGLAFQIKDDLLDAHEDSSMSFIHFLGVEGSKQYLDSLTREIENSLEGLKINKPRLKELIQFNGSRGI